MELTAIFESWLVGDGNYPPLHRGQLVRLSFELQPKRIATRQNGNASLFQHQGDAEYLGRGQVIRKYTETDETIAVIAAGEFRFFIDAPAAADLAVGDQIEFEGTLHLDHYVWVEFLGEYPDPPDLFYNLRVTRIRKVQVPERFIQRQRDEKAKTYPAHVSPSDFGAVEELETMDGQRFDEEFYVIDFDSSGVETAQIPRTFL